VELPFAEMSAITLADYVVTVDIGDAETPQGDSGQKDAEQGLQPSGGYAFRRMGNGCEPFYAALCEAYNAAVLKALFVEGSPTVTANGNYQYSEGEAARSLRRNDSAFVAVYENCVTILPPNLDARRVPLCFVVGMDKGDYALTLRLDTGESYTISKLGYDSAPCEDAIQKAIRAIRERTLAAIREIDPSLSATEAAQIAKLLPEGAAAPMGTLAKIAPSFVKAVEGKLAEGRAAESYRALKQMSDPGQIYVGLRRKTPEELAAEQQALEAAAQAAAQAAAAANPDAPAAQLDEIKPPDPFLLWLIAESPNGQFAAVEFAEENSATYVYRVKDAQNPQDFAAFVRQLNRALEAVAFKRDAIRLTDQQLRKPENADYYMAATRTAALRFVRSRFVGRAIHSNPAAWKKKVTELWSGQQSPEAAQASKKQFCTACGANNTSGTKFCGNCGAKFA
jgi:hypothetical protein